MPKGKGAKLSKAQIAALAAGRVKARAALAKANERRKQDTELARIKVEKSKYKAKKMNKPHLTMPAPVTVDIQTGEIALRNPADVPMSEWLQVATSVAKELGREAIEGETDWAWMGDHLYKNVKLVMVLNSVLPTSACNGNTGLFPKNAIGKIAKRLGARINCVGKVTEESIEPPFNPVWEEA